jgi:hypothetical protein
VPVPPAHLVRDLNARVHEDPWPATALEGVEPVDVVAEQEALRVVACVEVGCAEGERELDGRRVAGCGVGCCGECVSDRTSSEGTLQGRTPAVDEQLVNLHDRERTQ